MLHFVSPTTTLRPTDMIKTIPDRQTYERLIIRAAFIIDGFMHRYEAPTCREQQEVLEAAIAFLDEAESLIHDNQ